MRQELPVRWLALLPAEETAASLKLCEFIIGGWDSDGRILHTMKVLFAVLTGCVCRF
jgi:hypothetical protein